jgi:hypothetical protein
MFFTYIDLEDNEIILSSVEKITLLVETSKIREANYQIYLYDN